MAWPNIYFPRHGPKQGWEVARKPCLSGLLGGATRPLNRDFQLQVEAAFQLPRTCGSLPLVNPFEPAHLIHSPLCPKVANSLAELRGDAPR